MTLVLASTSATRRAMLTAAGIAHEAVAPGVDEEAAKAALSALSPRDLADALAELKAVKLSSRMPGALVLGGDQVLELEDGGTLDKAADREDAAAQLRLLSDKTHKLHSAAVIAQDGRAIWRHVDTAKLTMRPLSEAFIAAYLDREWAETGGAAGVYRIEGPGAQLFTKVEGSHFTILGLPLLPLLYFLRVRGELPS